MRTLVMVYRHDIYNAETPRQIRRKISSVNACLVDILFNINLLHNQPIRSKFIEAVRCLAASLVFI